VIKVSDNDDTSHFTGTVESWEKNDWKDESSVYCIRWGISVPRFTN